MSLSSFVTFSLFMLVALVGLVFLGNWQIERRHAKHMLIQMVDVRAKASPVNIEDVERARVKNNDINYLRVQITGEFDHSKERYFFATFEGLKGWHVYTPLKLRNGRIVFVNRGFVSDGVKAPDLRKDGQIAGEVTVIGLVRKPGRQGYFDPKNDLKENIWYWRDLNNMVASVFDKTEVSTYPFFVEAEVRQGSALWPKGGVTRTIFRDSHLQYALTWYGLAITLFAVYGFFLRNWLRQRNIS